MPTSYEHQINKLLDRFNFHFTKSQVKQVIDTVARSKDDFKRDVLNAVGTNTDLQNKLNELGLLALQLDTRQVELFNVTEQADKIALNSLFATLSLTTEQSIIDAFPFPVENVSLLNSLQTSRVYPVLRDSVSFGGETYKRIVASVITDREIEEPVPASHLSASGIQLQNADTTFMMKRRVRTQLFHVIYWSENQSRLILSVDRASMSRTACQTQLFIMRQFLMANSVDHGDPINVFHAIGPMYDAADGYITKVGHVTTDSNPVRIPLKGSQKCLKQDSYHNTGETAGYVHAKFAVTKKWEFPVANTTRKIDIEVGLMGHPKMLDTSQPLTDFSVNKSSRLDDFNFAIEKVLLHLP